MSLLVVGLLVFLGVHSVRIVAEPWRQGMRARVGENAWKGAYSLASAAGLALIVWGYALSRQAPMALWQPMGWARHVASALTWLSFVLLTAAYVPGNGLKARLGHPMLIGVALWALAHLLANHTLADLLLFGGFLAWSVAVFIAARKRDRAAGTVYPPGRADRTVITLVVGVVAWTVFALWLHAWWIGVRPFGA